MIIYGAKVEGKREPVDLNVQSASIAGGIYELIVETEPFQDNSALFDQLLSLEQIIPDLKVVYIETCQNGKITLQFIDVGPGQFGWEMMLAYLPQLLLVAGIIMIAASLFGVIPELQRIPAWAWYLLGIGGGLVLVTFLMGKWKITIPTEPLRDLGAAKKDLKVQEMQIERAERDAERREQNQDKLQTAAREQLERTQKIRDSVSRNIAKATSDQQVAAQMIRLQDADASLARYENYMKRAADLELNELKRQKLEAETANQRALADKRIESLQEIAEKKRKKIINPVQTT